MIPVIFEITQSRPTTTSRMKMTRRITRVGGPYASTAALAAETATSFVSLDDIREPGGANLNSCVQPADHISHGLLIVICQISELDAESVGGCVMDHFARQ